MYTGSCLCGGIQFQITTELAPVEVCHCRKCRKAQGTPFATNSPVKSDAFRLMAGESLLAEFESSRGKKRVFCRRCGSPIYSVRASLPGVLRIRVGLVDDPVAARPVAHAYVSEQCSWWPISDLLPQFRAAYMTQGVFKS
jgi:hypothetical protein